MLPIRRLLLRDLLILMAGLCALILGLFGWRQQQALARQAAARTGSSLHHLEEGLRLELGFSQSLGQTIQRWWLEGTLDPGRPEEALRLLLPLLSGQQNITGLNLVREDGLSLLFSSEAGAWSMQERIPQGAETRIRRHGDKAATATWTAQPGDPRALPWYRAGAASPGLSWTEPYAFAVTGEPGVTCTLPVRDARGLRGVAGLDFRLDDLTPLVWSSQPTARSRCLVVDPRGRLLVPPGEPRFRSREARRSAFLEPLGPGLLEAQALLSAPGDRPMLEPLPFRHQGERMLGFASRFDALPGINWHLLITIPEADLLGPALFRVWSLLGMAALSLGLAAWRILHIAHRVADPITRLGAAAEQLGQGTVPPPIHSSILEIRSLDRALRRASESLADQARLQSQLEHSQRMETVGTLAGGIAHDVNNQLAAILGQLHLCREALPPGHSALGRIERAEEATRRSAQTTKALLSFSHRSLPELRRMDFNALVRETAGILEPLLGGRIRLQLELAPDLPPVAGDAVQLEQVLMNLGVNARDAMPAGGTLNLITRSGADGRIQLEVRDTGTGIAAAVLPRLFEPFTTTKDPSKGTGLGLAMVFSILKAHRGEIQAENLPEGGARFLVCLPAAEATAPPTPDRTAGLRTSAPTLAGRRILVAEDELLLREMLADALTLARMQVTTAPDGELAWRAWQHAPVFDLVLSDHRMPDCTGFELLTRIRNSGSSIPFILVSGQGLEGMEASLAQDPFVQVIPKPFELSRLMGAMEELLAQPLPAESGG